MDSYPINENGDESKLLVTFYNGHGEILTDLQKRKVEVRLVGGGPRGNVVLELEMRRLLLVYVLLPIYLGTFFAYFFIHSLKLVSCKMAASTLYLDLTRTLKVASLL